MSNLSDLIANLAASGIVLTEEQIATVKKNQASETKSAALKKIKSVIVVPTVSLDGKTLTATEQTAIKNKRAANLTEMILALGEKFASDVTVTTHDGALSLKKSQAVRVEMGDATFSIKLESLTRKPKTS